LNQPGLGVVWQPQTPHRKACEMPKPSPCTVRRRAHPSSAGSRLALMRQRTGRAGWRRVERRHRRHRARPHLPARNKALAHQLAEDRADRIRMLPWARRPCRSLSRGNRLISGVSRGVLVVEAAPDSGSLITHVSPPNRVARVFAIPGSIHSPLCTRLPCIDQARCQTGRVQAPIFSTSWPGNTADTAHVARKDHRPGAGCAGWVTCTSTAGTNNRVDADAAFGKLLTLELDGQICHIARRALPKTTLRSCSISWFTSTKASAWCADARPRRAGKTSVCRRV